MESKVANPQTAEALAGLAAAVDGVADADLSPADAKDAVGLVTALEREVRRLRAASLRLQREIGVTDTFRSDGHRAPHTMVAHVANLSEGEARRRKQLGELCAAMPAFATALAGGAVSLCAAERLARAYANPRVREGLVAAEERLTVEADRMSYRRFDWLVCDLVSLLDQDGARDRNDHNHTQRNVSMIQNYDQSWTLQGNWAALQGARIHDVLQHFISKELAADWTEAREAKGDQATTADLARTPTQRRADALAAMCEAAAAAPPDAKPGGLQTHIVIDWRTYQAILTLLATCGRAERDPRDIDGYRCSTIDGHPLEPTEAVVASLIGHVRRVVMGADSTVIDLGRRSRLFTGSARLAAQLSSPECVWPGCHRPTSQCDIDHLHPYSEGGTTSPANGAPLCGFHNRWKQKGGFTVRRHPTGHWQTRRPDHTLV